MTTRSDTEIARALGRAARAAADQDVTEAAARLAETAAEDGHADLAYATVDTPVGRLVAAASSRGLVRVGLPGEPVDRVLEDLSRRISPRLVEAPGALETARRELDEFFAGRRTRFDLPLDWRLVPSEFRRRVLRVTAEVPFGSVITYAQAAELAGNPRAHRAAGSALGSNPIPIVVPCHRVVRTGGALGNYGGGLDLKRRLLELEGAIAV